MCFTCETHVHPHVIMLRMIFDVRSINAPWSPTILAAPMNNRWHYKSTIDFHCILACLPVTYVQALNIYLFNNSNLLLPAVCFYCSLCTIINFFMCCLSIVFFCGNFASRAGICDNITFNSLTALNIRKHRNNNNTRIKMVVQRKINELMFPLPTAPHNTLMKYTPFKSYLLKQRLVDFCLLTLLFKNNDWEKLSKMLLTQIIWSFPSCGKAFLSLSVLTMSQF